MKKFQHINFIVSTVCECRLELLNLHDLFPCGKAGRGGGGCGGQYRQALQRIQTWYGPCFRKVVFILLCTHWSKCSPHIRESTRILDSGFHILNSRFPGSGFQSLQVELGFRIPIVSGILDSLSCISWARIPKPGFPYMRRKCERDGYSVSDTGSSERKREHSQ